MAVWRLMTAWRGLLLALWLWPALAAAQEGEDRTLRLAHTEFPPYSMTRPDGTVEGLAIDVARQLTAARGYELEFVPAADPGITMDLVASGAVDMSAILALTPDRLARAPGTEGIGVFESRLFVKRGRNAATLEEFTGARIGVVSGSLGERTIRRIPFAELVTKPDIDGLVLALLSEEVDAVAAPYSSLKRYLRSHSLDPLIDSIEEPLSSTPFGFFVSPGRPDVLVALNAEIRASIAPGDMAALAEPWFGAPTRLAEHDALYWRSVGLALASVLAALALLRWFVIARRSRRILQQSEENRLFIDALDGIDTAVIVYDQDLRAVHWNTGFAREFPLLLDTVEAGGTFEDVLVATQTNGTMIETKTADEAATLARDVIARVMRSEPVPRQLRLANGKVFEANDFKVGDHHYASVRVDVTRSHDQAALIEVQKAELEVANKNLQTFSTIAAHDLKAPLLQQSSLLEFIEEDLTESGQRLPDGVVTYFTMLERLSSRMTTLIDDLLDYARAGSASDAAMRVDPNPRMETIILTAGLPESFRTIVAADMPEIHVAPASFDTVMRNLISNAAKHHHSDTGCVKITARQLGEMVEFRLEDDGNGIPKAYQSSIFDPFTRLSGEVDGSGLGLSFVKKSVKQWGGDIRVESDGETGSTFVLTVPAATPAVLPLPDAAPLAAQGR